MGESSSELVEAVKATDSQPIPQPQKIERKAPLQQLERITLADFQETIKPPELGGSIIILQRNAKDNRTPGSADIGALEPNEAEKTRQEAKETFNRIFSSLDEEARKTVDVLIVASDATLITPEGTSSPHKRAVETANQVISGLQESMQEFSVAENQSLNISANSGKPVEVSALRDLRMLEDSPEFVDLLRKEHGTGKEFWEAYEDDRHKEDRIKMGAEGPIEIANRMHHFVSVMKMAAAEHHKTHPNRRLIVWAVSHYDAVSPYIKEHVTGIGRDVYLPVDYRAGIVISVGRDGSATTKIQGQVYNVPLAA